MLIMLVLTFSSCAEQLGLQGSQGEQGSSGPQGVKGDTGDKSKQGTDVNTGNIFKRDIPKINTVTTIDNDDTYSGQSVSITIGSDGLGIIAYTANILAVPSNRSELKVAHCADIACTSIYNNKEWYGVGFVKEATTTPAIIEASVTKIFKWPSITIGTDRMPVIAYYSSSSIPVITSPATSSATSTSLSITGTLSIAHCSNIACTSIGTFSDGIKPVIDDSSKDVGQYPSIVIGSDGFPLISYYDATNDSLKVAHCSDIRCTSTTTLTTIDNDQFADVGKYSSITIGSDGLGLISYYDATNTSLKVAHCANIACTSANVSTLDFGGVSPSTNLLADVGKYSSITIGSDGLGLISYYDATKNSLKVAH